MPTVISSGNDYDILNVNLTDTFQDIIVPTAVKSFAIQIRGGSEVKWRKSAAKPTEWTFKIDQTYAIDGSRGAQAAQNVTIGQAKCNSVGGTDVLEIWYWYI